MTSPLNIFGPISIKNQAYVELFDATNTLSVKIQAPYSVGTGSVLTLPVISSDTLAGIAATQTLTNKTIAGGSNTITGLSLTTAVTGVLPIANGGTNSSTSLSNSKVIVSSGGALVESTTTTTNLSSLDTTTSLTTQLSATEKTANKGAANGYVPLDASTKISVAYLPSVVMEYQGAWNASTNSPSLADGTGTNGNVYMVSVANSGTVSGLTDATMTNFQVGNIVIYSSSLGKWQQTTPAAGVSYVNGAQGSVTVNAINELTGDVTASAASGSQSKSTSLVATSNSTLTTLSGLTTASSLSSIGTITTGTWHGTAVAIGYGGTGQTTANASLNALLPTQTSNSGKVLTTDGTNTSWLAATGGSGQKNYLSTSASTTTGWGAIAGTGATTNATITLSTDSTTNSPRPYTTGTSLKMVATAASGGTPIAAYAAATFELDPADYNTKLRVQFAMNTAGSYTSNDYAVNIYSGTSAWTVGSTSISGGGTVTRLPLSTDVSAVTGLPALEGTFTTTFDAASSSAPYVLITFSPKTTATSTLYVSDLIVGPGVSVQGAAFQYLGNLSFTPNNFGTITNSRFDAWRIGNIMRVHGYWISGTTVSSTASVSLPTGYTIDSTEATSQSNGTSFGTATFTGSSGGLGNSNAIGITMYDGSSTGALFFATSSSSGAYTKNTASNLSSTGDAVDFWADIPIAQWTGAGTLNVSQNDIIYYSGVGTWGTNSTISTVVGPSGSLLGSTTPSGTNFVYTIVPTVPIPIGAAPIIQMSSDQVHWAPVPNSFGAGLFEGIRYDGTNYIGMGVSVTSGGNLTVIFGKYAYGTSGAWNGTFYWRVAIGLPGQAVGFGIVQPGISAGLVSSAGVPGNTTGNAISSSFVGEMPTGSQRLGTNGSTYSIRATATPTGSFTSQISATLGNGIYLVSVSTSAVNTGGSLGYQYYLAVGGTAVTNTFFLQAPVNDEVSGSLTVPVIITAASTAVALYAKDTGVTSGAGVQEMWVVRIA